MNGPIWWTYTPSQHKTAHYDYERTIYIGPRGQRVIEPFLQSGVWNFFLALCKCLCMLAL